MRKSFLIFLMCLILPASQSVWALAIADVELKSFLNQPLNAQIYMLSINAQELKSLNITIIEQVGDNKPVSLEHEIMENDKGHFIKITSREVIREPILSFQLELNWSSGRLIRDYSLLVDPQ